MSPRDAHPPLVLVMDDDPSIRRALSRLLRSAGLAVETFASAAELPTRGFPVRPVCLVLDVHLADMNGLDVLRRLLAMDPDLSVLIVTADTDPKLREKALQAGAAAFLIKPFDEDRLLAEIHRALLRQDARQDASLLELDADLA